MSTNPQKNHAASAIDAAALMNLSRPVASSSAPSLIAPLVAMPPPLPPMLAAASMASPQKREPQEEDIINGAFDGNGRSPRRPVINRPVDHPYTDFAAVSDAELRNLDRDNSILNSPTLSHEKRQLMSILKLMPSKVGGVAHNFPAKVRRYRAVTRFMCHISHSRRLYNLLINSSMRLFPTPNSLKSSPGCLMVAASSYSTEMPW